MAEALFDLIFRGDIVPGHNIAEVKQRLAQLFKVQPAKIEALFTGGVVPIKRNLDRATADKYQTVLLKAGAQVELRQVGDEAKPKASAPQRPLAADARPAAQATSVWSLAPAGSNLLKPTEIQKPAAIPQLDLSGMSLKPLSGDLLEEAEKTKAPTPSVIAADFDIAPAGSDLLEGFRHESLPLPEMDPEFDLADPGVDLIDPADRPQKPASQVNTDHLTIAPLDPESL